MLPIAKSAAAKPRIVGILGGMGPAAGADFARLFVGACADHLRQRGVAVSDQAFPEHWLAQVPVPDRSTALELPYLGSHQPLEPMLQTLGKLAALGATTVAVACNTAHAWHATLQSRFPHMEVLHMAQEVAALLAERGVKQVGLLATEGTYSAGVYEQAFRDVGVQCHVPTSAEVAQLMRGIYSGVKVGNLALAGACFLKVAEAMAARHALGTLLLGCTEIPLALPPLPGVELVNSAVILARAFARRSYADAR